MSSPRIAVLVGSLRHESFNRHLARAVATLAAPRLQLDEIRIDDLPLYNQDFDAHYPATAARLKAQIESSDALLFVTPEYNRSMPGVLKNAIDIGSRPQGRNSFSGRPAAVIGTSPGAIGTALAQQHLRTVLAYLDVPVLGQPEVYLRFTPDLIAPDGSIGDDGTRDFLRGFVDRFASWIERFRA